MRHRFAGHLGLRGPDRPLFRWSAASASPADQIAYLADQGFAGVFDNLLVARAPDEQATIGVQAARRGLAFGSIALDPHGWATPLWSRTDPAGRDAQRAVVARAIAAARRVGTRTATCVTGLDPLVPVAAQHVAMAENLRRIGDHAGAAGLCLCIEPVPECFIAGLLVQRLAEAARLVARVGHPAIRLAYDVGHVGMGGDDPVTAIAGIADMIGVVQIADLPGRVEPGAGSLDWRLILDRVAASGYTGLIELEFEPTGEGGSGEAAMLDRLRAIDRAADSQTRSI